MELILYAGFVNYHNYMELQYMSNNETYLSYSVFGKIVYFENLTAQTMKLVYCTILQNRYLND